jgi:hypothetical protein
MNLIETIKRLKENDVLLVNVKEGNNYKEIVKIVLDNFSVYIAKAWEDVIDPNNKQRFGQSAIIIHLPTINELTIENGYNLEMYSTSFTPEGYEVSSGKNKIIFHYKKYVKKRLEL